MPQLLQMCWHHTCLQTGFMWAKWSRLFQVSGLLLISIAFLCCGGQSAKCLAQLTTSPLPCLTAIGFNVETVTYKNIKFQVREQCCAAAVANSALAMVPSQAPPVHHLSAGLARSSVGLGPWRTDEHPALLALLLPQHTGMKVELYGMALYSYCC